MTSILPSGSLNPNSTIAPGVYVLEKLPTAPISGVETNNILVVGTASWGPVNSPVNIGSLSEQIANFGKVTTNNHDLGTHVYAATSVNAASFTCVRVTDGTDVKASITILDDAGTPGTGLTVTARYTGTVGNSINVIVAEGTNSTVAAPTYKITILFPTGNGDSIPEVFDNIGGTGATLWQNMADAINLGQGALTAPSQLITAAVGTSIDAPDLDTRTLTGGTDGNDTITTNTLIGSNTLPLTGMYSATDTNFSLMCISGLTDSASYIAQAEFAQNQGAYAILAAPLGQSYADAITTKKTLGLDNYAAKFMVGESWISIQDTFNNVRRYIAQQGLVAGLLATIQPQQSGLNKRINSNILVSTWFADQNKNYTRSDMVQILSNGLDTVSNPSPGGNYWALQTGKNTSSNILANGDNFTRLTNFIAASVQQSLGRYIGTLQSKTQRTSIKTALDSFFNSLATTNVIGATNGGQAFSVVIDDSNNPPSQIAKGVEVVDIQVAFLQVVVAFLVNLQTGLVQVRGINQQS